MFISIFRRLSDGSLARMFNAQVSVSVEGEAAAEWAFHATNAPTELLDSEQEWFNAHYRASGPDRFAVSVGDVVQVGDKFYRCDSSGWTYLEFLGSFDSSVDEDEQDDDDEHDMFRSDAEADADALASCGWGCDEDYNPCMESDW